MLEELFNKYRSDKGTQIGPRHSYTDFYEKYLDPIRNNELLILEIGLCDGKSLRTWYEYLPNSTIIGLDLDYKTEHNNDSNRRGHGRGDCTAKPPRRRASWLGSRKMRR